MSLVPTNYSYRFARIAWYFQRKVETCKRLIGGLRSSSKVFGFCLGAFQIPPAATCISEAITFIHVVFISAWKCNGPTSFFFISRNSSYGRCMASIPWSFHTGCPPVSVKNARDLSKGFRIWPLERAVSKGGTLAIRGPKVFSMPRYVGYVSFNFLQILIWTLVFWKVFPLSLVARWSLIVFGIADPCLMLLSAYIVRNNTFCSSRTDFLLVKDRSAFEICRFLFFEVETFESDSFTRGTTLGISRPARIAWFLAILACRASSYSVMGAVMIWRVHAST